MNKSSKRLVLYKNAQTQRLKAFFKKRPSLLGLAVILWAIAATSLATVWLSGSFSDQTNTQYELYPGQIAEVEGSYAVRVTKIYRDRELEAKMRLPENQRVLVAHTTLKNTSAESFQYLPSIQTYLRDSQGTETAIFADISQPALPPKELKPGETIEGNVAFLVDNQNINRWLYFDLHINGASPILFNVTRFDI